MNVKRSDSKVWIDRVKGFTSCEFGSSVHGSQARILEYLGQKLDYADLVCYSGFAFRVNVHDKMCPSGGHPCCGYMCIDNGLRAISWEMKYYPSMPWSEPKTDRAAFEREVCEAIKQSIDRGVPVHYSNEEDGLIIGYADGGKRWWCLHPYYKNGQEAFWYDQADGFAGGDKWPWGVTVWTQPKADGEIPDDRELTVAALTQAVSMWSAGKRNAYFCGERAYENWLEWLQAVQGGTVDDPAGGMQGNGWYYAVLIQSRKIAGTWLADKADIFSPQSAEQLKTAAGHYAKIAEVCSEGLENSWALTLGPKYADNWTSEMRQSQISRLKQAFEHDRQAIEAISKALKIIEQ